MRLEAEKLAYHLLYGLDEKSCCVELPDTTYYFERAVLRDAYAPPLETTPEEVEGASVIGAKDVPLPGLRYEGDMVGGAQMEEKSAHDTGNFHPSDGVRVVDGLGHTCKGAGKPPNCE